MKKITCTHCGRRDKIEATYACFSKKCKGMMYRSKPRPAGLPAMRPCPKCGTMMPYTSYNCTNCGPTREKLVAKLKAHCKKIK